MLNVALIGAGRIGAVHAENLEHTPGARLIAIADPDLNAARDLAARLREVDVYPDPRALWTDRHDVDAVIIASATHLHAEHVVWSAEAGKHIFCEKPISFDLEEVDAALLAVERAGVKLQVGFNRRFDPNFVEVKRSIDAGEIGVPHILRITSRDPAPPPINYIMASGGLFFDMTIHDFDMARHLCGDVVRVHAFGGCRIDPGIEAAGDIDTAVISLEFANGAFGTIDNSRQASYGYDQRIEVFGSEGSISADNNTPHRTLRRDAAGEHAPRPLDFFVQRYADSYRSELRAFVEAITNDTRPAVTGSDARYPIVLAAAAMRSLQAGTAITLG